MFIQSEISDSLINISEIKSISLQCNPTARGKFDIILDLKDNTMDYFRNCEESEDAEADFEYLSEKLMSAGLIIQ